MREASEYWDDQFVVGYWKRGALQIFHHHGGRLTEKGPLSPHVFEFYEKAWHYEKRHKRSSLAKGPGCYLNHKEVIKNSNEVVIVWKWLCIMSNSGKLILKVALDLLQI